MADTGERQVTETSIGSGNSIHVPVLLHEVVEALMGARTFVGSSLAHSAVTDKGSRSESNKWYLDGTLGGAGHALALKRAFEAETRTTLNVIGLDRDSQAIERARETLKERGDGSKQEQGKLILEVESFRNLDQILDQHGIKGVDMILLDLGISSDELDNSGRGFTFQKDEPLLMTLGEPSKYAFTAKEIVNGWEEDVIADVIFGYGEERFARRIAKGIVEYRAKKKIETTFELVEIVKTSVPAFYRRGKVNPATKTFQALRIAVNDELNALKEGLSKGYERLNQRGRMAVISFHSLEDRIVKDFNKQQASKGAKILTKKPITPSTQEIAENPRSRSAKLRIIEKI